MKVLLVVSIFPPVRHIGAWRWGRLCRQLVPMGCNIHVVTTTSGFWSGTSEDAEPVPNVQVDRVSYPKNLIMAYLNLVQWGARNLKLAKPIASEFEGKHDLTKERKGSLPKIKNLFGRALRFICSLLQPIVNRCAYPHYSKYWAKSVVRHCKYNLEKSDYDVIIASHPYAGTLMAASRLSKKWNIPWIADFRDPWTHDHQGPFWDNPSKVNRMWKVEGEQLASASAIIAINKQMLNYLHATDRKKHVITNSFNPLDYDSKWTPRNSKNQILNLCYAGSLGEGYEYHLFLDGLKMFQGCSDEKVIFHYYGNDYSRLEAYAGEIDLNVDCLNNHGTVSHQVANQALANADCGIVFGWRGSMAKIVATGKVFDSLGVGVPILGICSVSGSAMQDIIEQSASGAVLHSVTEIADFLNSAVEAKKGNQLIEFVAPNYSDGKKEIYTTQSVAKEYKVILEAVVGNH